MFGNREDHVLRAVHFKPGVSVVIGGRYAATTYWALDHMPDVLVEEKANGDLWMVTPSDGRLRIVHSDSIAWRLYERPGTEAQKVEPALVKKKEAERMYADKFKAPIKGTEKR